MTAAATVLVLDLPAATPSLNTFQRHRFAARDRRRRWITLVRDAHLDHRAAVGRQAPTWPCPPHAHVRVTVERFSAGELDRDNFVGGLKPVLDALRALELIDDDTSAAIELNPHQRPKPRGSHRGLGTRITLERTA